MAYLQFAAAVFSVVFSLLGIAQGVATDPALLNPFTVAEIFRGANPGVLGRLVASFMVFQMTCGWLMGLLLIVGGVCCLKRRGRRFVAVSAIVNLINFPHGTTVAIMVLHGLSRPGIAQAFREPKQRSIFPIWG